MVLEIETAPASIYAATTAMNAALDAADAVLVTVHNLAFETKRDGLAEHLGVAELSESRGAKSLVSEAAPASIASRMSSNTAPTPIRRSTIETVLPN